MWKSKVMPEEARELFGSRAWQDFCGYVRDDRLEGDRDLMERLLSRGETAKAQVAAARVAALRALLDELPRDYVALVAELARHTAPAEPPPPEDPY